MNDQDLAATPGVTAVAEDDDGKLNQEILDVLAELIKQAHDLGQGIAAGFGLTGSDAMALAKLDAPMTMKDLGLAFNDVASLQKNPKLDIRSPAGYPSFAWPSCYGGSEPR